MRAAAILAALVLALVAAAAGPSSVAAHAQYVDSTPGRGEVLDASPLEVSITFSQDVQRITGTYGIEVLDADGNDYTAAPAELDDDDRSVMTAPLQPDLAAGRYVVEWRNVSDEDGDPTAGAFSFYVGVEPTAEDLAADAELGQEPEETPPGETPTAGDTPQVTPPVDEIPGETPTPSAPIVDPDDGDGNLILILVVAVIAAIALLVVVGFAVLSRRSG